MYGGGEFTYMSEYGTGENGAQTWQSTVGGSWGWSLHEGWFGHGVSCMLRVSGSEVADGHSLEMDGNLGTNGHYVVMDEVRFGGGKCDDVFSGGMMTIRQDETRWVVVTFAEDCSGCGTVTTLEGEEVGEVCPDIADQVSEVYDNVGWSGI